MKKGIHQGLEVGGEYSQTTSVSTSLLWKFRWQPQAAHVSAPFVPSSPLAMNSLHPSTAYPPMFAAWFFWHSAYRTVLTTEDDVLDDELLPEQSFFTTTWRFFILQNPNSETPPQFFDDDLNVRWEMNAWNFFWPLYSSKTVSRRKRVAFFFFFGCLTLTLASMYIYMGEWYTTRSYFTNFSHIPCSTKSAKIDPKFILSTNEGHPSTILSTK